MYQSTSTPLPPGKFCPHVTCLFSVPGDLVWSLNAKFEPDRDKADKSAKLCIQFPWDMSMKSEMGAQEKKLPVTV